MDRRGMLLDEHKTECCAMFRIQCVGISVREKQQENMSIKHGTEVSLGMFIQ